MTGYFFDLLSMGTLVWEKMASQFDVAMLSPHLNPSASPAPTATPSVTSFELDDSVHKVKETLKQKFPLEVKGIDDYFRLLSWSDIVFPIILLLKLLPQYLANIGIKLLDPILLSSFAEMTTADITKSCTTDKDLQGCLAWMW